MARPLRWLALSFLLALGSAADKAQHSQPAKTLAHDVIALHIRIAQQLGHLEMLIGKEPLRKRPALGDKISELRAGLRYRRDKGLAYAKTKLLALEARVIPFERDLTRAASPEVFAVRQRAFTAEKLSAQDCIDSPLLFNVPSFKEMKALNARKNATSTNAHARSQDTRLPCKREFTIHPEDKKDDGFYITEISGPRCVRAEVHADRPVHACLLPASTWYAKGPAAAALDDATLCPCRGVRRCMMQEAKRAPGELTLLFVRESKDRSKLSFKSYNDLTHSFKPVHIAVFEASCDKEWQHYELVKHSAVVLAALAIFFALVRLNGDRIGRWLAKSKTPKGYSRIGVHG